MSATNFRDSGFGRVEHHSVRGETEAIKLFSASFDMHVNLQELITELRNHQEPHQSKIYTLETAFEICCRALHSAHRVTN